MTSRVWSCLLCGLWLVGCKSTCVLDDDVRLFAGDTARDCGTSGASVERADVDACVVEAFEGGEPFIARYERQSLASKVVTAVAANSADQVKIFQWDQAPCGGSGCDPVTDVQTCQGPMLNPETSEDADALPISCEDLGLPERTCG